MTRAPRVCRQLGLAALVVLLASGVAACGTTKQSFGKPDFRVLLVLRHRSGLSAFARRVSDPRSPSYRRYESNHQLSKRFGASAADLATVKKWIRARNLSETVGPGAMYVIASGTRPEGKRALGAVAVAAPRDGQGAVLPVPSGLRGLVDGVQVLGGRSWQTGVPAARRLTPDAPAPNPYSITPLGSALLRTGTPAGCAGGMSAGRTVRGHVSKKLLHLYGFTPNQYTTAYGLPALYQDGWRGQGERVALVSIDGFKSSDVATFAKCFGLHVPHINITSATGANHHLAPGEEATLDVEVLTAAAPRLAEIDDYEAPATTGGILEGVSAAITAPKPPTVLSMSLGECEPLLNKSADVVHALNNALQVAAGIGISAFASSGDNGSSDCESAGKLRFLAVASPADQPYLTAVGGTNLQLNKVNHIVNQTVWNDSPGDPSGGGGGVSNLFGLPWYQDKLPGIKGKIDHRLTPDISGLADKQPGYAFYCTTPTCRADLGQDGWGNAGGTSASTPFTAAAVAIIDQAAHTKGERPLGFLNPLIYQLAAGPQHATVLDDVTTGSNDLGTALSKHGKPLGGYPARTGYDLATGWGSLNLAAFSKAAITAGRRPDKHK